ncbi:MAG: hypothetical protein ACKVP4_14525 [Hyphomicrobium sp.]
MLFSAALLYAGAVLTRQETDLVDARLATRPSELGGDQIRLERAADKLAHVENPRSDVRGLVLDLSLALERTALSGSEGRTRDRVLASANNLVEVAPLDPRPWCLRAIAEAQTSGATNRMIDWLRTCYAYGRRTLSVVETRVLLGVTQWRFLPQDLRNAVLIDASAALSDPQLDDWMANVLAYAVRLAPAQSKLAGSLIEQYAPSQAPNYARLRNQYSTMASPKFIPN